ncbi:ATP-binding domain-containing protein [Epidermidibacterium keratini]|uniref:ATP-binding domain-containing protein n=1 Tax=Epidermidibacterium keratini TaxID=1891644 RepID=A0A7L4YMZ9_9ACTN|nr:ATP-binding domain-containing protein [Epidermidibacterium keratini]QHC00530.1 ATP-binding domain-containing protein [Epidermidibacterium keratini]
MALLDELAALVGAPASLGPTPTPAETFSARAASDRTWAYGHVIVDEAQELSAMQWRALARRCPALSFTIVGDVNQTANVAGASSWDVMLRPLFGDRLHERHLTICYRTPREVIDLTPPILAAAASTVEAPRAARSNGITPYRIDVLPAEIADIARNTAQELAAEYAGGQVAVIWPDGVSTTARSLALPHCSTTDRDSSTTDGDGSTTDGQESTTDNGNSGGGDVVEVSASGAKGLEFDAVVLVEPALVAAGPRGWNTLYVALTRCTQQLVVVASTPGPSELAIEARA